MVFICKCSVSIFCNAGAELYQLRYQAIWELVICMGY